MQLVQSVQSPDRFGQQQVHWFCSEMIITYFTLIAGLVKVAGERMQSNATVADSNDENNNGAVATVGLGGKCILFNPKCNKY